MSDRQPYAPPNAPVRDTEPPRPRPVLGVILGGVVDLGGTTIAVTLVTLAYAAWLTSSGMPIDEIQRTLTNPSPGSAFFLVATLIGTGFSILGGYVCASFARISIYRPAFILALLVGVSGYLLAFGQYSNELNALLAGLSIAAVLAGAYLYERLSASERG